MNQVIVAPPLRSHEWRVPWLIKASLIGFIGFVFYVVVAEGLVLGLAVLAAIGLVTVVAWRWPMAGVMALVLFGPVHQFAMMVVYNYTQSGLAVRGAQLWKELIIVVLLAKVINEAFLRRKAPRFYLLDLLVLMFLAISAFYLLYPGAIADNTLMTKIFGLRANSMFLLAYFIGRGLGTDAKQVTWLLYGIVAIGFVVAAVAVAQFAFPTAANSLFERFGFTEFVEFQRGDATNFAAVRSRDIAGLNIARASSLFLSDLALAFYQLLMIPIALAMLYCLPKLGNRILANLFAVTMIVTIALTVTRSAMLAVPAVFGSVSLWSRNVVLAGVIVAQVVLMGLAGSLYMGITPDDVQDIFSPGEASVTGHQDAFEQSLVILREEPLGQGLGTSGTVAQRFNPDQGITNESWYLQIATDTGVAAALLFGLIVLTFGVMAFGTFPRLRDPANRALALGMAGATIGFGLVGAVLHAWEALTTSYLFWLLAGIVVTSPQIEADRSESPSAEGA